ncbi:MAG: sugar transporter [Anaerolineaceae bacterium]|nr:sugar transporter [Anaerolineaceae bacterium]
MILQFFLPRPPSPHKYRLARLVGNQESIIALGLIFMLIAVGISNPRFLAERNISDVLQGHAYVAVAAIGMSMVIITGNIDISVGSLIGLLAVICGRLAVAGAPIWLAWLAPLLVGAAVGALIGFLVAYMRIPSIVVTLGMLSILKGILIIWTNGERVTDMPEGFFLAQMRPLGIPMPIWFMIVLTILAALWMRYSGLGRSLYAVGGNAEAARLSGISQKRVVLQVFIINGIFVGFASILYATQFAIIQVTPPPGLELTIISSSVVGGVSILGGTGTVIGSSLAAILLNTIRSAMVFINVSPFWLQAVQGVLILVTVLADLLRRRRQID